MRIGDVNPFVRFARKCELGFKDGTFVAPDHRIFYCVGGKADVFIDNTQYNLSEGSVIYWPAGFRYRVVCGENANITGCNFDFFQDNAMMAVPIGPTLTESGECRSFEKLCFCDMPLFNAPFVLHNAFVLKNKFLKLADEFDRKQIYYALICSAFLKEILIGCIRFSQIGYSDKSAVLAMEVLEYIRENHCKNLTNAQIGEHFCYHPNYLNSLVVKCTGKSMHKYLMEYRISSAISLFQAGKHSVSEVAAAVGIPDIKHFSRVFKSISGVSPSQIKIL